MSGKSDRGYRGYGIPFSIRELLSNQRLVDIEGILGKKITPEADTYSHPSGTTEKDVIEITITEKSYIAAMVLDFSNLTKNTTVRLKQKVDGTNYITIDTRNWNPSGDPGVPIAGLSSDVDVKVTIQSSLAEGASRDIPYRAM